MGKVKCGFSVESDFAIVCCLEQLSQVSTAGFVCGEKQEAIESLYYGLYFILFMTIKL